MSIAVTSWARRGVGVNPIQPGSGRSFGYSEYSEIAGGSRDRIPVTTVIVWSPLLNGSR